MANRSRRIGWPSPALPGVYEVPLTRGRIALVDAADFEAVSLWSWSAWAQRAVSYARANTCNPDGTRRYVLLHVFLANPPAGLEVDHKDGDGLNNRRGNLRVCSHQQNMRNMTRHRDGSSRFKGVSWFARDQRWRAYIVIDGRQKHLGYFDSELSAAAAYDAAALSLFGEYARTNHP